MPKKPSGFLKFSKGEPDPTPSVNLPVVATTVLRTEVFLDEDVLQDINTQISPLIAPRLALLDSVVVDYLDDYLEYGEREYLIEAFTWEYTKQGYRYWSDIYDGATLLTPADADYLQRLLQDAKEAQGIL